MADSTAIHARTRLGRGARAGGGGARRRAVAHSPELAETGLPTTIRAGKTPTRSWGICELKYVLA
jgi:hypothetical protein